MKLVKDGAKLILSCHLSYLSLILCIRNIRGTD